MVKRFRLGRWNNILNMKKILKCFLSKKPRRRRASVQSFAEGTSSSEKLHSVVRSLLSCRPWVCKELCLKIICSYYIETNEMEKKITLSFGYIFRSNSSFHVEGKEATIACPKVWSSDLINEIVRKRTQEYSKSKLTVPFLKTPWKLRK